MHRLSTAGLVSNRNISFSMPCARTRYGMFTQPDTESDKNSLYGILWRVFILHRERHQHRFPFGFEPILSVSVSSSVNAPFRTCAVNYKR